MKFKKALLIALFLPCSYLNATSLNAPKDPTAIAEACRQIALKVDWLGRYQDREACTKNLDGLPIYIASQNIANKKYNDAKNLLTTAVYQINFSIDTNCYGQDDMKSVVKALNEILNVL